MDVGIPEYIVDYIHEHDGELETATSNEGEEHEWRFGNESKESLQFYTNKRYSENTAKRLNTFFAFGKIG